MKGTDPQHGYNHRREWSLILMLMLLAVLLMFSVSQRALAMQAAWQVNADMISLINPDGTIAAYIGEGQVEPVAQQILTPLSFNYLTPVPPGASVISTNTAIIHVTIPSMTPTLAPTERPTDRPPDAADPTSTNTKTNTRVVVFYTPSNTPTSSEVPTSAASPTFTRSSTPTRTFTFTTTGSKTRTSTKTFTPTHTRTFTSTQTYTRTNTLTPSQTYTRTNTLTSTQTFTHTNTLTPSETPTYTLTFTPSLTPTYTQTFTPTDTPSNTPIPSTRCSNNKSEDINIGSPDDICTEIFDNRSPWDINLGSNPITSDGDTGWDFIYYEVAEGAGIRMDVVILQISADGSDWHTVFDFGDGAPDNNSSIGAYGYAEADNIDISSGLIGGTGIGIDIDGLGLSGSYSWFRIISPGYWQGNRDQGCDLDAIETNP